MQCRVVGACGDGGHERRGGRRAWRGDTKERGVGERGVLRRLGRLLVRSAHVVFDDLLHVFARTRCARLGAVRRGAESNSGVLAHRPDVVVHMRRTQIEQLRALVVAQRAAKHAQQLAARAARGVAHRPRTVAKELQNNVGQSLRQLRCVRLARVALGEQRQQFGDTRRSRFANSMIVRFSSLQTNNDIVLEQ